MVEGRIPEVAAAAASLTLPHTPSLPQSLTSLQPRGRWTIFCGGGDCARRGATLQTFKNIVRAVADDGGGDDDDDHVFAVQKCIRVCRFPSPPCS